MNFSCTMFWSTGVWLAIICLGADYGFGQNDSITSDWEVPESRQFDFWIGTWDVNLRMIQSDHTWKDSVNAKVEIFPVLDGKAILELWDSDSIKGFSLRYYDPARKKWVLYLNWPGNGQSSIGSLEGEFRHGRGEFFTGSGKNMSRYTFCDITRERLRWDDAFTRDAGKSWTNRWIMEFSRTGDHASWPSNSDALTYSNGGRCTGKHFDQIGLLAGKWKGAFDPGEHGSGSIPVKMNVYRILDGCSVIRFMEYQLDGKSIRNFSLISWNASRSEFEELFLDNRKGTVAQLFRGKANEENDRISVEASTHINGRTERRRHQWIPHSGSSGTLQFVSSTKKADANWKDIRVANFQPVPWEDAAGDENAVSLKSPINEFCPRSGKPVSSDSLTTYRGHTVGFCNTHCRDDFAENVNERPSDRIFFDKIILNQ